MLDPLLAAHFWSRVAVVGPNDCWLWTGPPEPYGKLGYKGKLYRSHRLAWQLGTGMPIPADLMVCHHCDIKLCCNPKHLYLGTPGDNIRDMFERIINPRKTHCYNGHPLIHSRPYRGSRVCRLCEGDRRRRYQARVKARSL